MINVAALLKVFFRRSCRAELSSATLRLDAAAAVQAELEARAEELSGRLEASESALASAEEAAAEQRAAAETALQVPPQLSCQRCAKPAVSTFKL